MVSDLYRLSTNLIRESRRKKNCVRKTATTREPGREKCTLKKCWRREEEGQNHFILGRSLVGKTLILGVRNRGFESRCPNCSYELFLLMKNGKI